MKRMVFIFLLMITTAGILKAQDIAPAPTDKAVVYFVRWSSLGFAVNFSYFDSTKLIGRFNGPKYTRYECEPGHHLFWARSENRDFMSAELEAGKIYFIEATPQMGGIKAGVQLHPVDPNDSKKMKRILKLLKKKQPEAFSPEELEKDTKQLDGAVERGLEKYRQEQEKGKKNERLEKNMYYTPESTSSTTTQ